MVLNIKTVQLSAPAIFTKSSKPQGRLSQPAFTYSKLRKETLEQGVKYVGLVNMPAGFMALF